MKNITLAINEKVLDEVREIAVRRRTTVNALVRDYLTQIASEESRIAEARKGLLELMENSTGRLGPDYVWNREEIYEDRMFPRHKCPIYAATGKQDDPRKFKIAEQLVGSELFGVSGQVLAEFYVNVLKKPMVPLSLPEAERWIDLLCQYPVAAVDENLVRLGIAYARKFRIKYWDAAIVAAAERLQAPVLYTEDLNHNQLYGSVRVVNPFRPNE